MSSDGKRRDEYEARAMRLGVPFVDLQVFRPDPDASRSLSGAAAQMHQVLPIKQKGNILYVAVAELVIPEILDALFVEHGCYVKQVLAVPEALSWAIQRQYGPIEEAGS